MIRLQYASDLHLEFAENGSYIKHHPLQVTGDILVLAGDIGYLGDDNYSLHPFWDWASDNYEQVVVVPGNHCTTDGRWTSVQMSGAITTPSFPYPGVQRLSQLHCGRKSDSRTLITQRPQYPISGA